MKRCILYVPYELPEHGSGPNHIRPRKMVQAFRDLGYDVFVICGRCAERKKRIKKLKENIETGCRYEFMYTESSSIPTLLTEPNHICVHPLMDFNFFNYIKKQGIKIGLFYRDIIWKFDYFLSRFSWWKRRILIALYQYDIKKYEKLIDRFYIPSMKMADMVNSEKLKRISSLLFPGADDLSIKPKDYTDRDFTVKPLHIFYAGSIHEHYHLEELLKAVSRTDHCVLTLCCREYSWMKEKERLEPYLSDNIQVIHKNNDELQPYYESADIGALFYENNDYMDMAMPFKSFEYLANEIPVIATAGTFYGKFTELNGNGWVISYNADAACELLNTIIQNPKLIREKQYNCIKIKRENLWIDRAREIEQDLLAK